ncbi:MAG: hypothetical protein ABR970_17855 [Roseiarcus sp.]|jgi:hypothetical protein
MRSIDDILADAQNSVAASVHEAFEAGRRHAASELRARMVAYFDALAASPESAAHEGSHVEPPSSEEHRRHEDHPHHEGHSDHG